MSDELSRFRAGDWVEVRPAVEILATLDESQCLEGLPFMPEMLQYCGKRFRVHKSAHKTCDTIESYTIRRLARAVHLEDLRCDGAAHGGCQAGCLLFWKDAWLRPVPAAHASAATTTNVSAAALPADDAARLDASTRVPVSGPETDERFRCQATELLKATSEVRRRDRWNPLFYVRDITSGNVRLFDFV